LAKKIDFTAPLAALAEGEAPPVASGVAAAEALGGAVAVAGLPEPDELPHAAIATAAPTRATCLTNFRMNMSLLHVSGRSLMVYLPSTR